MGRDELLHLGQRIRTARFFSFDGLDHAPIGLSQDHDEGFEMEVFLASKIVIDHGFVDPGPDGDLVHPGAVTAPFGENIDRRVDDLFPRAHFSFFIDNLV